MALCIILLSVILAAIFKHGRRYVVSIDTVSYTLCMYVGGSKKSGSAVASRP